MTGVQLPDVLPEIELEELVDEQTDGHDGQVVGVTVEAL